MLKKGLHAASMSTSTRRNYILFINHLMIESTTNHIQIKQYLSENQVLNQKYKFPHITTLLLCQKCLWLTKFLYLKLLNNDRVQATVLFQIFVLT